MSWTAKNRNKFADIIRKCETERQRNTPTSTISFTDIVMGFTELWRICEQLDGENIALKTQIKNLENNLSDLVNLKKMEHGILTPAVEELPDEENTCQDKQED